MNPITVKEFKELYCLNRDDCFPCGDGCKKLSEALTMARDKGFIKQTSLEIAREFRPNTYPFKIIRKESGIESKTMFVTKEDFKIQVLLYEKVIQEIENN